MAVNQYSKCETKLSEAESLAIIKNYKPNSLIQFLTSRRYYTLIAIYFLAIVYLLVDDGLYMASVCAVGLAPFFLPILLAKLLYPSYHLQKYIEHNNLEDAIKNDTGKMNVAIAVYNVAPRKRTISYIKSLNKKAAQEIERQLAERKK